MLRAERLYKRYSGVVALDRVDFEAARGEILGIIGPNGAGKTTLLNILSGIGRPFDGDIWVNGVSLKALRPHQICALGIGRTFQVPRLFHGCSVLENVVVGALFGCARRGTAVEEAHRAAVEVAREVGLGPKLGLTVDELSIQDAKRLELARALSMRPALLLLDEVMAGLTDAEVFEIMELVRCIRRSGVTIVLVEHVMKAVMGLADRVLVLDQGRVIATGTPRGIVDDPDVIRAYLGSRYRSRAEMAAPPAAGRTGGPA